MGLESDVTIAFSFISILVSCRSVDFWYWPNSIFCLLTTMIFFFFEFFVFFFFSMPTRYIDIEECASHPASGDDRKNPSNPIPGGASKQKNCEENLTCRDGSDRPGPRSKKLVNRIFGHVNTHQGMLRTKCIYDCKKNNRRLLNTK